jgi:hypothetical protein
MSQAIRECSVLTTRFGAGASDTPPASAPAQEGDRRTAARPQRRSFDATTAP